jgi:hypothetical protein
MKTRRENMKRSVFLYAAMFLYLTCFFTACVEPPYFMPTQTVSTYKEQALVGQFLGTAFTFKWKVVGTNLDCVMGAPGTGWVAVGFNDPNIPASSDKKTNANIIIGYVVNGSEVHIQDNYGTSLSTHEMDVHQDVTAISGTETASPPHTEINFTIPLNSGDTQDIALVPGNQYYFFIAYSSYADDFVTYHDDYCITKITL